MEKYFVIPVLVMALVTAIIAPPAQAELVAITVILVAAFSTAVVTAEVVKSGDDNEIASSPKDSDSMRQASIDYSDLEPVNR